MLWFWPKQYSNCFFQFNTTSHNRIVCHICTIYSIKYCLFVYFHRILHTNIAWWNTDIKSMTLMTHQFDLFTQEKVYQDCSDVCKSEHLILIHLILILLVLVSFLLPCALIMSKKKAYVQQWLERFQPIPRVPGGVADTQKDLEISPTFAVPSPCSSVSSFKSLSPPLLGCQYASSMCSDSGISSDGRDSDGESCSSRGHFVRPNNPNVRIHWKDYLHRFGTSAHPSMFLDYYLPPTHSVLFAPSKLAPPLKSSDCQYDDLSDVDPSQFRPSIGYMTIAEPQLNVVRFKSLIKAPDLKPNCWMSSRMSYKSVSMCCDIEILVTARWFLHLFLYISLFFLLAPLFSFSFFLHLLYFSPCPFSNSNI